MSRTPPLRERRLLRVGRWELLWQTDDDESFPDPRLVLRRYAKRRQLRLVRRDNP